MGAGVRGGAVAVGAGTGVGMGVWVEAGGGTGGGGTRVRVTCVEQREDSGVGADVPVEGRRRGAGLDEQGNQVIGCHLHALEHASVDMRIRAPLQWVPMSRITAVEDRRP